MPVAAPGDVIDTRDVFGLDVVGFGVDMSSLWGPMPLNDGTIIRFKRHPKCGKITAFDERNLSQCKYLNICWMVNMTSIKLENL